MNQKLNESFLYTYASIVAYTNFMCLDNFFFFAQKITFFLQESSGVFTIVFVIVIIFFFFFLRKKALPGKSNPRYKKLLNALSCAGIFSRKIYYRRPLERAINFFPCRCLHNQVRPAQNFAKELSCSSSSRKVSFHKEFRRAREPLCPECQRYRSRRCTR